MTQHPFAGILPSEMGMVNNDLQRHQLEDTKESTKTLRVCQSNKDPEICTRLVTNTTLIVQSKRARRHHPTVDYAKRYTKKTYTF
jgi:hypothetical protein